MSADKPVKDKKRPELISTTRKADLPSGEIIRPVGQSDGDRRTGGERRDLGERRVGELTRDEYERRRGADRRRVKDRRRSKDRRESLKGIRIPIFVKLAALSILLIVFAIAIISAKMLEKQKELYLTQLKGLGEGMIHILTNNAPDKLLGEEELALFNLVKDIAKNDQIVDALIADQNGIIRAHSEGMSKTGKPYKPPSALTFVESFNGIQMSTYPYKGETLLFFQTPLIYQNVEIGSVGLAVSKRKMLHSITTAKKSLLLLTLAIILFGVLLSLGLSMYFSRPINKLKDGTEALGKGDFNHRVTIGRNDELGDLGSAFNKMAVDLALKETIQDSFGRYVTPEIVDLIIANPDKQWMRGTKVEASVLFVDIRGFTTISEDKDPGAVVDFLNGYFSLITDSVIRQGGHINKFLGDEAMAVFGTPIPNAHHAEAAVQTALDIQKEIIGFWKRHETFKVPVKVGIGISSGEMVAGNVGSRKRMEYTVIGDDVNVASRLTALAGGGEIIISNKTYDLLKDQGQFKIEQKGQFPVRGRRTALMVYRVLG